MALNKEKKSSSVKLWATYLRSIKNHTTFSAWIESAFAQQEVYKKIANSESAKRISYWCANANVALQNERRDFFAMYEIWIKKWMFMKNKLKAWVSYRKERFTLKIKWETDFIKKKILVDADVKFVLLDEVDIWWWIKYDSSIWKFVPNFIVSKTF